MDGAFFQTQSTKEQQLLSKAKSSLNTYVNRLDVHIEKALRSQNNIVVRKKNDLLHQLQLIKERTGKETLKKRKMEEYFVKYCENILKDDINKWENNQEFFKQLFEDYQSRIKVMKVQNWKKRDEIERKKAQVKAKMKEIRKTQAEKLNLNTQQMWLNKKLSRNASSKSQAKTRMKTQLSLPSLPKLTEERRYMEPIKHFKKTQNKQQTLNLLDMLEWYRGHYQKSNYFLRVMFQEQQFQKLKKAILPSTRAYTQQ